MERIKNVTVIAHGFGVKGFSGEKRVYLEAIKALQENGIGFKIVSFFKPSWTNEYEVKYLLPFQFTRFDKYQRLLIWFIARRQRDTDLFLNLSGVPIPLSNISKHVIYAGAPAIANVPTKYSSSLFWRLYIKPWSLIIKRLREEAKKAIFIANSYYSKKAIEEVYQTNVEKVIYPPVNVEFFSKAFNENDREPIILTIGRFERGKMLENTIKVSSRAKVKAVIVGTLSDKKYFEELNKLAKELNADVTFLPNIRDEELLDIMRKASVYFHPTIGEHFGIPVVEAMSAGLIPIVPKESGSSEVVPEFSYSNLEEASDLVLKVINSGVTLRREIQKRALAFSSSRFRRELIDSIFRLMTRQQP
ncbi:MAG: glycosyltransferase family 4 protein [Sulfolobaceae archaeon]|nr:glycosyltransferase family 4 protein [Sulfolobaceae archaeon]